MFHHPTGTLLVDMSGNIRIDFLKDMSSRQLEKGIERGGVQSMTMVEAILSEMRGRGCGCFYFEPSAEVSRLK